MSERKRSIEQQLRQLLRCVVGDERPDETKLVAELWRYLTRRELDEHERGSLGAAPQGDDRSGIEELTETRVRQGLAHVTAQVGIDADTLPKIVLARGTERSAAEATLVHWDLSGRPDELPAVPAEVAPDATFDDTAGQELDPGAETFVQADEQVADTAGLDRTFEQSQPAHGTRLQRTLGHSLDATVTDADSLATSLERTGRTLVVTDRAGAHEIDAAVSASGRATVRIHHARGASSTKPIQFPSRTVAKVDVVDLSDTLDEVERVLLWSIPGEERRGLARRAAGGTLEGQVLGGKYVVGTALGQGGFGTVYKALDRILETPVAIKVLNPKLARRKDALASFLGEAQRLTAVDHPNIVRWISFDRTADGLHYFVMEYLEGEVLHARMRRDGPLDWRPAGELILQILDALRAAHELPDGKELLHLDLKPQNVFVLPPSGASQERAKVIDFGISSFSQDPGLAAEVEGDGAGEGTIARPATAGSGSSRGGTTRKKGTKGGTTRGTSTTAKRVAGGTVLYASPEQCKHIAGDTDIVELDGRADLYSLGVMAFEMLTGEHPFKRPKSPVEAIRNHLTVRPKKVQQVNKRVPKKLAAFVDRLLEKDRDQRWASADEAHAALDRVLHPLPTWVRYVAVAAVLVAAAAVTWGLTREGARTTVEFRIERGDDLVDLVDQTVRLEVGGAGRRLLPQVDVDPVALEIVDESGASPDGFALEPARNGEGVVLFCRAASDGPDGRVALKWIADGEAFSSSFFQLVAVPPFELARGEDLLSLAGHGPVGLDGDLTLVPAGLELELSVDDPHGSLDHDSARFVPAGADRAAEIEFPHERNEGTRVRFALPLERLAGLGSLVRGRVRLTDEFGREHETRPVELRLTDGRADLSLLSVSWRHRGRDRAALRVGSAYVVHATVDERPEGELVLRCRSWSPSGSGTYEARGPDFERGLFPSPADADGVDELALPLDEIPDSFEVVFEAADMLADDPKLVRGSLDLTVQLVEGPPCTLLTGGRKVDFGAPHVLRSARHELTLRSRFTRDVVARLSTGPNEAWFAFGPKRDLRWSTEFGADSALRLEFYAPERCSCDLVPGRALEPDDLDGCLTGQLICARDVPLEIDDSFGVRLTGVDLPAEAREAVRPDALAQLGFETAGIEGPESGLERVDLKLRRNGRLVEQKGLTGSAPADFVFDGWARLPQDGAYELQVEARDRLGNVDRLAVPFHVNERGPAIDVVAPTEDEWTASDGRLSVRVRIQDDNGVDPESVWLTVRSAEEAWADDRVRLVPLAAASPVEAGHGAGGRTLDRERTFVTEPDLIFPPERSGEPVELIVEASDLLHRPNRGSWTTTLGSLRPVYAPAIELGDGTRMILVQPPIEGSYPFAEYDLEEDPADRLAFARKLDQLGAHYASEPDLGFYLEDFRIESPPAALSVDHVRIRPYYLDAHEVSRGSYREFLEAPDGYDDPELWKPLGGPPGPGRKGRLWTIASAGESDLPMESVSWGEAWAYARWVGKRLPTYLEWEFAVRGGAQGSRRIFACEATPQRARVPRCEAGAREANVFAQVGSDEPIGVTSGPYKSAEGFWHLCGNVSEWTSTPYLHKNELGSRSDWVLTPYEPEPGSLRRDFWLVGADHTTRSIAELSLWLEHDFRKTCKRRWDPEQGVPGAGFRCAIDADVATRARER